MYLSDTGLITGTLTLIHSILSYLGIEAASDLSPAALRKLLDQTVQRAPAGTFIERVGSKHQFDELKDRLRGTLDRLSKPASEAPAERRNSQIEQLRLWILARSIHVSKSAFPAPPTLPEAEEALVQRQLRALEQMVRALVRQGYGGEAGLRNELATVLSKSKLEEWNNRAEPGNILSGSTFSDLSALFLDKSEYPDRHDQLFSNTLLLRLLGRRQDTLRLFLTYATQARNSLAHLKIVHSEHAALLELCFSDIVEAIQEVHDRGETKVNPSSFMQASTADLGIFLKRLQSLERVDERLAVIPESIAALHADVGVGLTRLRYVLAGVSFVGAMTAGGLWLAKDAKQTSLRTEQTVNQTVTAVGRVETTGNRVAETTDRINQLTTQTALQVQQAMEGDLPVEQPTSADHYWHNFALFERRGKSNEAEIYLLGYVRNGGNGFDALIRGVEFLRNRYERSEIKPLLMSQVKGAPSAALRTALARLLDPATAESELVAVRESWPTLAMPILEQARLHSTSVATIMTNYELLKEHELLGLFLKASNERPLGLTLQQPGSADPITADAVQREGNLNSQTLDVMRAGVTGSFKSVDRFPLELKVETSEPVQSIEYQIDRNEFLRVGDLNGVNSFYSTFRTSSGLRQAPALGSASLSGGQLPHIHKIPHGPIEVPATVKRLSFRYTDLNGKLYGPFTPDIGIREARLAVIEKNVICRSNQLLRSKPGFRYGITCGLLGSETLPMSLEAVVFSFTGTTPDQEAYTTPGLPKGEIELLPPPRAERFVYQLVMSDGSITSVRSMRP